MTFCLWRCFLIILILLKHRTASSSAVERTKLLLLHLFAIYPSCWMLVAPFAKYQIQLFRSAAFSNGINSSNQLNKTKQTLQALQMLSSVRVSKTLLRNPSVKGVPPLHLRIFYAEFFLRIWGVLQICLKGFMNSSSQLSEL